MYIYIYTYVYTYIQLVISDVMKGLVKIDGFRHRGEQTLALLHTRTHIKFHITNQQNQRSICFILSSYVNASFRHRGDQTLALSFTHTNINFTRQINKQFVLVFSSNVNDGFRHRSEQNLAQIGSCSKILPHCSHCGVGVQMIMFALDFATGKILTEQKCNGGCQNRGRDV